MAKSFRIVCVLLLLGHVRPSFGQIPEPTDAPKPLAAEESVKRVKLPPGFRLELVAAEPLVREPTGVCWDEKGRLFVCELHGYNLEGQYDIEELNKTGMLDLAVRRIQANPQAKKKAAQGTYGTVKMLIDTDGSGRMDKAVVYADRLPPCYGICPAKGGVIVACAPDIVYLADTKGDGKADVREVLFTGFARGPLERGINCPQWGPDNWIYFGQGHAGGIITGPRLKKPVMLPKTDFRIKADGSAIEPIGGTTHTIGFAFTEMGDRFVSTGGSPAYHVAPLPWHYLVRNPNIPSPALEENVSFGSHVYPISEPHPWRRKRAENPGYVKFYGTAETTPNGNFTSACSPFVYLDGTLPGLRGDFLACEPAQNMVTRAKLDRDGLLPRLRRAPGEEKSEFLASSDIWFHPIALAHAPDGTVWLVDFYREIIEDYSAVPRYLQQIYGLTGGKDHGRIWRLTHRDAPAGMPADMSRLKVDKLVQEVVSPYLWRRQTARRLLIERGEKVAAPGLARLVRASKEAGPAMNALYTLDGLGRLKAEDILAALAHDRSAVRVHALRLSERWFGETPSLLEKALALAADPDPAVVLQTALSLGEGADARVLPVLARLARDKGDQRWLPHAILSSLSGREMMMLTELLQFPAQLGKARVLLEPLCYGIGARRNAKELSAALVQVGAVADKGLRTLCLKGLRARLKTPTAIALNDAGRAALLKLASGPHSEDRVLAQALVIAIKIEDPVSRKARLAQAARELGDVRLGVEARLAAVAQLAAEDDAGSTATLLAAFGTSTPKVREAILNAVFSSRARLAALVEAMEKKTVPASALSAVQRAALLEHRDAALRQRAAKLLKPGGGASEETFRRFAAALANKRDLARGEKVFQERCATCHQVHGLGVMVGPDLNAEFRRAEETILTDILAPGAVISPGYATYTVETTAGQVVSGILASESATGVTLRLAEGKEQTVLRKDIERLFALPVSLMPEDLVKVMSPQDVADVIAWLRSPPNRVLLLDEDPALAAALNEGKGTATFVTTDKFSGQSALRVTPPQRFSPRINGWEYRVRENPLPGEFRYLRFAWKSDGAKGVLIELANNGNWPDAKSPSFRYVAGPNTSGWQATIVSPEVPKDWTVVTRDLWKDFGDSTITGIAPTPMGGPALFDRIELLRSLDRRIGSP